MSTPKLFISHATNDGPLVKAFVDLLEGGIGVPPRDIFCTSLKGQGIKPGADFKASIREHLDDATCVIALITPNFYGSAFCMCEMGGVWLQAKSFIPVVVPPLMFSDLKAVLAGLQALKIGDKSDLDLLRDDVAVRLSISALPTPRWNQRRDDFLGGLPDVLKLLPAEPTVARAAHEKALEELEEYKAEYEKAQGEIQRLQSLNTELKSIKDPSGVAAVVRRHSSSAESFRSLAAAAKNALSRLPLIVRAALYSRSRGEDYFPVWQEESEEVRRATEDGQLKSNSEDTGVVPNSADPKVAKAISALEDFEKWLDRPPADFQEWYEATYEDSRADLQLRPFWKKHLQ